MQCPSCGETNRDGAPFCTMCKAVLNRTRASAPERREIEHAIGYREPPSVGTNRPALVFLDPPHASEIDLAAIAAALRIQIADARMRVGLASPAPVLACVDHADAEHAAEILRRAGLRAWAVAVDDLRDAPPAERVLAIAHDAANLALRTERGDHAFAWSSLRAAYVAVDTRFEVGTDAAGRAALARASAHLDAVEQTLLPNRAGTSRARSPELSFGERLGGTARAQNLSWTAEARVRRDLRRADEQIANADAVKRNEVSELTLHLIASTENGMLHAVLPATGVVRQEGANVAASRVVESMAVAIAAAAPHVVFDRRAERAGARLPPVAGLGAALGGTIPPPAVILGAFLAWRALRG